MAGQTKDTTQARGALHAAGDDAAAGQGDRHSFDRDPTPDPAISNRLLDLESFPRRYVTFPSAHEPVAIVLWIAHAHLVEQFEVSPILTITSAELRSGKTRLLDCLELLVPESFRVVLPSEAVVYTILTQRPRRTMLLDEADAIFGARTSDKYEGLRAILNAGNRRGSPVLRVKLVGGRREVETFDVFGPKAVAGIGRLPSTVADRAIAIRMRRRAPFELVARFRQKVANAEAADLEFDWSSVTVAADVTVPEALNDRAADSWEPLLAIADAAGRQWPARARAAALALSATDDDQVSVGIRLLGDIREAFRDDSHLATAELLRRLCEAEAAPWDNWRGKPLSARALASLLDPYRISPTLQRVGGVVTRGYFRLTFKDSFERYLPPAGSSALELGRGSNELAPPKTVTRVTPVTTPMPLTLFGWPDVADAADPLADRVDCSDYLRHQTQHRRAGGGWLCDTCHASVIGTIATVDIQDERKATA